jgi:ABC-type nitrate/sulfonate/bicarbonate transport system substrate-binding protein
MGAVMLDRRTFLRRAGITGLAVLAGPAALSACSDDAAGGPGQRAPAHFGAGVGPDAVQVAGWFTVAHRLGYFAAEGVDAEVQQVQALSTLVQAGRLQVGLLGASELLPFLAQNPDSDLVAAWTSIPQPVQVAAVPATSDVREFADLRGKRFATAGPGLNGWLADALCTQSGLSPRDVERVTIPLSGPAMVAALRQHRIDGGLFTDTLIVQTNELLAGDPLAPLRPLPMPKALATTSGTHYVLRRSTLERDRDFYTRCLRSVAKGFTFFTANVPAGVSIHLDAYPSLRRAGETRQQTMDRLIREVTPRLALSRQPTWATGKHPWGWTYEQNFTGGWEQSIPALAGKKVDISKIYTNELVGPAYDFDVAAIEKAAREYKIN